jgi:hypothetical protein
MSGVRAATVLALWGAAFRTGTAAPDEVLAEIAGTGRTAGVRAADAVTAERTGLPGPGEAGTGTVALLDLLRRGGRPQLVLPVAGDVRGLPPRSPALVPALDAGAAVVLAERQVVVIPDDGHWRVFPVDRPGAPAEPAVAAPSGAPTLFEAERDLDAAIRTATLQLTRLDVARDAEGVRDRIADEMRAGAVSVPRGSGPSHRHGSMLLAKVVSLEALLHVAGGHQTSAATRHQLASLDDALRPLASAVRFGRLAAVNELVDVLGAARPVETAPPVRGRRTVRD